MKIKKRDGKLEQLSFDKVIYRLKKLCNDRSLGILTSIDPDVVAQRVVSSIYDGVTSCELDEEAARIAISMTENPEYQKLASRIIVSNAHKSTHECFSEVMERLYGNTDKAGNPSPILADDAIETIRKHKNTLNFAIDYKRDYLFDYFGYKTLERSYLQKVLNKTTNAMEVIERPQHLYMRVAVGIHKDNIEAVLKTYDLISQHYYTHASPTLFNGGTQLNQYSSCFLVGTCDSLEGIFKTITDCGKISKLAGGIGVHITNIRAKGSLIRGTNGPSDGIIPMIKVYNEVAKYINQGGKRKGSFAVYIEPWHADVLEFLDLKKNQGHEDLRARDLFYSMWVPDLFMKCVEDDGNWYLMCPDECPGLTDVYGDKFESLYNKYVEEKRYKRVVKAQEVWTKILDAQIETGTPYIGYKDAVNKKCNQKNLGTIRSSNLCTEISLYSDDKEYGVCNLASIALPKYVTYDEDGNPHFDFEHLRQVSEYIIGPMNDVIDNNYYPVPETKLSNMRHRPIGIGVQGLVDVYVKMRLPFESEGAKRLNKEIFETIYYGCLTGSVNAAKLHGHYSSFPGSPFSEAKLQFDLAKEFDGINLDDYLSGRWDWDSLKTDLVKYGARNSMLLALMPTASTAQIMGNSEAFEPVDSCIFKRRVLSGEYIVVNKYLVEDLVKLGIWSKELKDTIIANDGSIQNVDAIPDDLKALYKTVWEISMKSVIEQARDRGVFVDQMQSMNLFMANPNYKRLTSMHFYAWKANLKTGMYYLRSKSSYAAGKFSIDANLERTIREKRERGEELKREEEEAVLMCSRENPEACMLCSS
jgi:ribonucleoside-diphosphate reductase alpha chain